MTRVKHEKSKAVLFISDYFHKRKRISKFLQRKIKFITMVNENETNDEAKVQLVKIPPFWPENTELWFAQIESQFALYKITTDKTKFNQVVGNLDAKVLQHVSDAVINPPAEGKYDNIKAKITECFAESSQQKMNKLLSELTLGDQKPSHLLNRQKELAGTKISNDFLKTLWLRQLPSNVQSILSVSNGSLEEIAKLADAIMDVNPQSQVSAVRDQSALEGQINELKNQVNELKSKLQSRSRSNSRNRTAEKQQKFDTCWYHWKFGDKATKCREPCNKAKN